MSVPRAKEMRPWPTRLPEPEEEAPGMNLQATLLLLSQHHSRDLGTCRRTRELETLCLRLVFVGCVLLLDVQVNVEG